MRFRVGRGCGHAVNRTGAQGSHRTFILDDELREMIVARDPIRNQETARRNGLRVLRKRHRKPSPMAKHTGRTVVSNIDDYYCASIAGQRRCACGMAGVLQSCKEPGSH